MKKFIKWLFKSVLIALIAIFVTNLIGSYFGFNIPVNVWTICFITLFRIPGVIILIIFFLL